MIQRLPNFVRCVGISPFEVSPVVSACNTPRHSKSSGSIMLKMCTRIERRIADWDCLSQLATTRYSVYMVDRPPVYLVPIPSSKLYQQRVNKSSEQQPTTDLSSCSSKTKPPRPKVIIKESRNAEEFGWRSTQGLLSCPILTGWEAH